jgi:hypothetical protein
VTWKLLNTSHEYFSASFTSAGRTFLRILGARSATKIGSRFVEQESITTAYFKKVAAMEAPPFQISQETLEGRAQRRFLL